MLTDFTVDLETMGTSANAAIISIAAVAFNRDPKNNITMSYHSNIYLQSSIDEGLLGSFGDHNKRGIPLFCPVVRGGRQPPP